MTESTAAFHPPIFALRVAGSRRGSIWSPAPGDTAALLPQRVSRMYAGILLTTALRLKRHDPASFHALTNARAARSTFVTPAPGL